MKEEAVKGLLERHHHSFAEHATIYGTVVANIGAYNNGIGSMMYTMREHVLHLNQEGVSIIAVDDMNGALNEDTLIFIKRKEIKNINLKMKLFGFRLRIQTNQGEILYKIRRSTLANPWHKQNLSYLILESIH